MRSIDEIAFPYREIFSSFKAFNSIQSKVFNDVYQTDKSVIISAPTGSGKTVVFELAIVCLLQAFREYEDFKIVYVAPIKALCSERYSDWSQKFKKIGVKCLEVTGDSDIQDLSELNNIQLIITTPEKWDSLTRKWKDYENIVAAIKLFMIDEVHLLNEDVRGPILETIVSRMKTIQYSMKISGNELKLRFICASATIPNIIDLTEWIGGKKWRNNTVSHFFGENERPVNLEKHILGFNTSIASFKFDMSLNYKLASIIRKYSSGKPTLIFCSSRKSVEMASAVLQKEPRLFALSENHKSLLVQLMKEVKDQKLSHLIIKGIAYHHAGLVYEDRNLIETAFRKGLLLTLVCTNTLAMGVNLPAHLVIIKSTEIFINGKIIEYSKSAVLQMIGRAGRPQYDLSGVAVIMTQQKYVKKYENLMNGATPVESHLHKHLAEHLNSEIVLQTITDLDVAMEWIRSTFLYVRACKSPNNYGLSSGITKQKIEKKLEEMSLMAINNLETNELITKDQVYGLSLKATSFGRLMARYYLSFETMKLFRKIRGNENYLEMFNTIIKCKEFSEFTLRVNEKKILNDLNDEPIRFPISGKMKTNENKISCLIQANFGNLTIQDPSMAQESIKMMRLGDRVSKALVEYLRLSKKCLTNGSYKSLFYAITISKCYRAKLWEDSEFICKQLKKIGNIYSNLLVKAGKTTLQSILDTDPQTLEMILNKPPPFGTQILEGLSQYPKYVLELNYTNNFMCVRVVQNNENYNGKYSCTLIIGNSDNELLMYSDEIDSTIRKSGVFYRTLKIINRNTHSIITNLIHDTLVGVDKTKSIILNANETAIVSTEPKKTKKSNTGKRKMQARLNFSKNSKKFKNNTDLEEYKSLSSDDDILFTTINTQAILQENNCNNNFHKARTLNNFETSNSVTKNADQSNKYSSVGNNTFNRNENGLKRKLSKFEYNIKSKLTRYNVPVTNNFDPNDFPDYKIDINYESYDFEEEVSKKLRANKKPVVQPTSISYECINQVKVSNQKSKVTSNFFPLENQHKILSYYNPPTNKLADYSKRTTQTNQTKNPYKSFGLSDTIGNQNSLINSENEILNSAIDLTKKKDYFVSNHFTKLNEMVDLTIEETNNCNMSDSIQSEPLDFCITKPNCTSNRFGENIGNSKKRPYLPDNKMASYFNENISVTPTHSHSNIRYRPYSDINTNNQSEIKNSLQNQKMNTSCSYKNSKNKPYESTELINTLMDDDDLFDNFEFSTQKALEAKQKIDGPPTATSKRISNEIHLKKLKATLNLIDHSIPSQMVNDQNISIQINTDNLNNISRNKANISIQTNKSRESIKKDFINQKPKNLSKENFQSITPISDKSQTYHLNYMSEELRPYYSSDILMDDGTSKIRNIERCQRYPQVNKKPNEMCSNFFNFERKLDRHIQISKTPHLKTMGNILNAGTTNSNTSNSTITCANKNPNTNWAKPFSDYTNSMSKFNSPNIPVIQPKYLGMTSRKRHIIGGNISKPENIFGTMQKQYSNSDLKTEFKKASEYYDEIKNDTGLMPPPYDYFDSGISQCSSISQQKNANDIDLLNTDEEIEKLLNCCSEEIDLSIDLIQEKNNPNMKHADDQNQVSSTELSKELDELPISSGLLNTINSNTNANLMATQEKLNENVYIIFNHDINKSLTQPNIKLGNLFLSKPKIVKEEVDILNILSQISDGNLYKNLNIPNSFESLDVIVSVQEISENRFNEFFEDDSIIDPNQKRNFRLPDIPNNHKMIPSTSDENIKPIKDLVTNSTKNNNFKSYSKTLYDEIVDKGLGELNSKNQRHYSNPSLKSTSCRSNQTTRKRGFSVRNNFNLATNYSINSDIDRETAAAKLRLKFNHDSTYDENNFTKDLITCMISDRGYQIEDDLNLKIEQTELTFEFSQNEAPHNYISQPENNLVSIYEDDELLSFGKFPECLNGITEAEYYDNTSNECLFDINKTNNERFLQNKLTDFNNI